MPTSINTSQNWVPRRELQRIAPSPSQAKIGFIPVNATSGAIEAGGSDPRNANEKFPNNVYNLLGFVTGEITYAPEKRDINSIGLDGSKISTLEKLDAVNVEITLLENTFELCMSNRNTRFRFIFPMGIRQDSCIDVMALAIGKFPVPEFATSQEFQEYPLKITGEVNPSQVNITYLELAAALDLIVGRPTNQALVFRKFVGNVLDGSDRVIVDDSGNNGPQANDVAISIAPGGFVGFGSFEIRYATLPLTP